MSSQGWALTSEGARAFIPHRDELGELGDIPPEEHGQSTVKSNSLIGVSGHFLSEDVVPPGGTHGNWPMTPSVSMIPVIDGRIEKHSLWDAGLRPLPLANIQSVDVSCSAPIGYKQSDPRENQASHMRQCLQHLRGCFQTAPDIRRHEG